METNRTEITDDASYVLRKVTRVCQASQVLQDYKVVFCVY